MLPRSLFRRKMPCELSTITGYNELAMNLPAGTVTFLFTDIEGSTRLWEAHPDAMKLALARHDALLKQIIEQNNGHVFKTVGDAFCAAFPTASDGLNAVLTAQLALICELWPEEIVIKVRMALHTGTVESRDGDYFGQPLNRVARLLATGYGQQILLSQATYELIQESLPKQTTLKDLGNHQLKDLSHSERVFQLQNPGLPGKFPPIKSLSTHINNLPQQVTSFIGREKELVEVKELLQKTRLLTLTGSGGSGKSRLSLQLAADVLENFPDGAFLIELAPLSDPGFVAQAVASVLSIKEEPGKPILTTLTEYLKGKKLLFLIDNCEHVLDSSAKLADALIRNCPGVQILATSREGLGIAGETTFRVPSLSLPDPKQVQTPESLSHFESAQLFIDRALQNKTNFSVTSNNCRALASICFRLDGIPLAIELAAARTRSLSVEEIDGKLDQRFRLLTGGYRTSLPRQQTLRSLIDWSYDLLSNEEKRILERLSVFSGGWTLEAAESVCVDDYIEDWEILDYLTSLLDKNLILAEQKEGRTRYRLLETIRQYARDRLLDNGTGDAVRKRHRDYFLTLAEEIVPKLKGAELAGWLHLLEEEHENFRASLGWSLNGTEFVEALRFCAALQRFWFTRCHLSEGREWCAQALGKPGTQGRLQERADTLLGAGVMARLQGDYPAAQSHLKESLALSEQLENKIGVANSLNNLGSIAIDQGDFPSARAFIENSLIFFREIENKAGIASSLNVLGVVALCQCDYLSARKYCEESLAISRELKDTGCIAGALGNLGIIANYLGDYSLARTYQEESLAKSREIGNMTNIASSLVNLGNVAEVQGDFSSAHAHYEESLAIYREIGHKNGIANVLNSLGAVALSRGDSLSACAHHEESLAIYREIGDKGGFARSLKDFGSLAALESALARAAILWGAAEKLREEIDAPLYSTEIERYEKDVASARTALSDDTAFDAAWAEGRALTLEQAVVLALERGV